MLSVQFDDDDDDDGHSLEACVPSVGFGASFHFTNDLNFFESWFHVVLSVITAARDCGLCF